MDDFEFRKKLGHFKTRRIRSGSVGIIGPMEAENPLVGMTPGRPVMWLFLIA